MLQGVMNLNPKVLVRIEYGLGEKCKVCHGEVEEKKIESFEMGPDDFICIENDGNITWLDKESIISIESLEAKKIILIKPRATNFRVDGNTDKDARICT